MDIYKNIYYQIRIKLYYFFADGRYTCDQKTLEETQKSIEKGFTVVYCFLRSYDTYLNPRRFLRDYFQKYAKRGYLPTRALRKKLRQSLPGESQNLRKELLALE